jgi:hypothetical protein
MPYTMEDFKREVAQDVLKKLTPAQRLKGLSVEERLEGLSAEEIETYLKKHKTAQDRTSPDPPQPPST